MNTNCPANEFVVTPTSAGEGMRENIENNELLYRGELHDLDDERASVCV